MTTSSSLLHFFLTTGNKTVSLTETCWGNVKVCFGGKCGGVCADSWTKDLSELLCKSLDCGNTVLSATKMHDKTMQWIFKSLHPTNQTTNLNQSSIVLNDTNICTQKAAYVVCSGNSFFIFSNAHVLKNIYLKCYHFKY